MTLEELMKQRAMYREVDYCAICRGKLEEIEYVNTTDYGTEFNGEVSNWSGKRKFYKLKRCTVCGSVYAK